MRRVCLATILVVLLPSPSPAQLVADPSMRCHTVRDTASILRQRGADEIRAAADGMVIVCERSGTPVSGILYDRPRRNALDMCSVRSYRIALTGPAAKPYEPRHDPIRRSGGADLHVLPPDDPCLPAGDNRYIYATDVPDGVFLELYRIWQQLQVNSGAPALPGDTVPENQRVVLARLVTDLSDPANVRHLRLTAIMAGDGVAKASPTDRPARYVLSIHDDRDWGEWYEIGFDRAADGTYVIVSANFAAI